MTKKFQSITNKIAPVISLAVIALLWLTVSEGKLIPNYMLPSPVEVVKAFISDFPILMKHSAVSLQEAVYGLLIGTGTGFVSGRRRYRTDFYGNTAECSSFGRMFCY